MDWKPIMSELVFVKNNNIFTTSIEIAKGVNHSHESVLKLINNSRDLEIFTDLNAVKISTKGRPSDVFNLTEEQATLLIALMRNTTIVRLFKQTLVREFFKLRGMLQQQFIQKNNAQFALKRLESKKIRKECTDTIKEFVEYAIKQGSKNASMYYVTLSKMELGCLFLLEQKFPNAREFMTMKQLNLIEMGDEAVRLSLIEGMELNLDYKDIYKLAKLKIEAIAKIFPPTPLPLLLQESK